MTTTIEAEVMTPETQIAVRPQMPLAQPMDVDDVVHQVRLVQQVMAKVMRDGEHYGTIPGCGDKKTLLLPGAQKLTLTFRLAPAYTIQETCYDRGHKEYRVVCTLKNIQTGAVWGEGVGCCTSLESKYRYRGGSRKCPKCGKETIIKGKAEYGGGWLCFVKKGGCGEKWPNGAQEIEGQSIERVENENPADCFNTVLKIAKKRAYVDATITATAASDIFTQDIGDAEEDPEPSQNATRSPERVSNHQPAPQNSPQPAQRTAAKANGDAVAPEYHAKVLRGNHEKATKEEKLAAHSYGKRCLSKWIAAVDTMGTTARAVAWAFATESAWIHPGEDLEDCPVDKAPLTAKEFANVMAEITTRLVDKDAVDAAYDGYMETVGNAKSKEPPPEEVKKAINQSEPAPRAPKDDEWWREIIVPVPHAGQKRDAYMKNPDSIGSLFDLRHGNDEDSAMARRRLWGFVQNYEPKGWEKRDGTKMPASASDVKFREALDAFADWFERNHPGEKL